MACVSFCLNFTIVHINRFGIYDSCARSNSDAIKSNRMNKRHTATINYLIQALYEQRHLSLALKSRRSIYIILSASYCCNTRIARQISGFSQQKKERKSIEESTWNKLNMQCCTLQLKNRCNLTFRIVLRRGCLNFIQAQFCPFALFCPNSLHRIGIHNAIVQESKFHIFIQLIQSKWIITNFIEIFSKMLILNHLTPSSERTISLNQI